MPATSPNPKRPILTLGGLRKLPSLTTQPPSAITLNDHHLMAKRPGRLSAGASKNN